MLPKMKVILSRKGFDSGSGGIPSPILPDGRLISLPIPCSYNEKATNYNDLSLVLGDDKYTYHRIIRELWMSIHPRKAFPYESPSDSYCHLDPDITLHLNPHAPKDIWKAAFGQVNSSQSHLQKQGILSSICDTSDILFLFYGLFRNTILINGKLCFDRNSPVKHIIWGYLQVDKIISEQHIMQSEFPWHIHSANSYYETKNNTLYIAKPFLTFNGINPAIPGAGTFTYNDDLVLTKNSYSTRKWDYDKLPVGLKNGDTKLSYHLTGHTFDDYFDNVSRGQEFVFSENESVDKWATSILRKGLNSTDIL